MGGLASCGPPVRRGEGSGEVSGGMCQLEHLSYHVHLHASLLATCCSVTPMLWLTRVAIRRDLPWRRCIDVANDWKPQH